VRGASLASATRALSDFAISYLPSVH